MGQRQRSNNERGQVLPLVAFALVPLIALASMAIDVGVWRCQQQLAQTAADSGALAAAVELANSGSLAQVYAAANIDATANGFAGSSDNGSLNTADGVTLTVNNPPQSGPSTSDTSALEVIITKTLPIYFGWSKATVVARAVATNQSNGNCVVALDPSSSSAITLDSGTISLPKCGMISDSGLWLNSVSIDAASIGYNSSYPINGGASYSATFSGASPQVAAPIADPCATVAACASLASSPPSPGTCYGYQSITAPVTLNPGTYCNTLFSGSGTVTLNPGLYYFKGGFNCNSPVPNFAGTGVTLYTDGTINWGTGTVNLAAPTSGAYADVLVYQPASDTSSMTFQGKSTAALTGLIYLPSAQLILDGTDTTISYLVAKDILINASGTISAPSSLASTGSGLSE